MSNWYKMPTSIAITEAEYRANINGMNIVFGAVLGFVLARIEGLPPFDFGVVLVICAAIVVLILYLSSTEYRLFYTLATAGAIWVLPGIFATIGISPIPNLQPTLAAWTIMVLVVELNPRRKDAPAREEQAP